MATQLELAQKPFIELQIEALVKENRIKAKAVNKFIDQLEARLQSIKELNYDKILDRPFRLPLIGRPNSLNNDYPNHFKFIPPQKLDVIGSFKTSTALKRTSYVDLAICMSAKHFERKDVKNQRYHHKRALFLAQLAHLLNGSIGSGLIEKLEFHYYQGDFLKPVLLIVPKAPKLKKATTFQLFAYPDQESAIKASVLNPMHGNVAPKWFLQDYPIPTIDSKTKEFTEGDSDVASTPFYNSGLLFDIEMVSNSEILYEQIGTHGSIIEALILTKIWLYQRELHHHFSFSLSMFLAYLQTQQAVHQNMSSYQIFKIIIKSLAASDWSGAGLSYFDDSKDTISTFKPFFPVVFLSPSGNLNLCYNITQDLYNRLKHEAQLSQNVLLANSVDTFELLFLKKLDFVNKFDVIVHLPKCTRKLPIEMEYLKKFLDHGVFTPRVYSESLLHLVEKSLTDRIALVQQSSDHLLLNKRWNFKSIPYDPSNEDNTFTLGLLLEAEKSLRIIDIGPAAQTAEAEEFRNFWEPKCQLRLQNGLISETLVWHVNSFSQRRAIIKYILSHAFKRADIHNVVVHYTLLERFISLKNVSFQWRDDPTRLLDDSSMLHQESGNEKRQVKKRKREELMKHPIGTGEEIFQKALHSYNELNKVLRNIEDLKHSITSIQPMSEHLRASSVFPPLPVGLQAKNKSLKRRKGVSLFPEDFDQAGKILHIEPIEILLTLESIGGSSKWPNELEALQAAKLEYLIQLGEVLREREYSVKFSENYLDVLHGQFVFRLRIKCAKELTLIATTTVTTKLEFQRRRFELEIMPRVQAALDLLYRERPAFGLTCRLVKRWIFCHLMTDHVSDIALDLMVANLFLHPQPYTEPSSSSCGFRRFLMLVSQHDFKQLPLIINFDQQLKIDEVNRLKDAMLEDRAKFPPIVIYTPYDKEISPWTRQDPSLPKLDLLRRICTKALEFFNKDILYKFDVADECKALFRPNFKLFNLIIKLRAQVSQNFFMSIDPPKGFNLIGKESGIKQTSAFKVMPIVGLNIVEQYVKLLRDNYDKIALFFYDKYGQRVIGVILKPEADQASEGNLKIFISGMTKLGSNLVESISVMK